MSDTAIADPPRRFEVRTYSDAAGRTIYEREMLDGSGCEWWAQGALQMGAQSRPFVYPIPEARSADEAFDMADDALAVAGPLEVEKLKAAMRNAQQQIVLPGKRPGLA